MFSFGAGSSYVCLGVANQANQANYLGKMGVWVAELQDNTTACINYLLWLASLCFWLMELLEATSTWQQQTYLTNMQL